MGRLLQAIAGIEGHDARQVQALPTMPTRELESLAAALRHLGAALDQAEAQRRQLSQQMLTLQEDERARLARDLHDEFGQRLTALRVDAAWLARQVAGDARLQQVVDGMAQQCALVQADIHQVHAALPNVPILGMGGVASGRDALEMIAAGASGVSVGTASFGNPNAIPTIQSELRDLLIAKGFTSLRDAIGFAHRTEPSDVE